MGGTGETQSWNIHRTTKILRWEAINIGTFDPVELRLYKQLVKQGGTVIDVGANVGSYAVPLAVHVGRTGLAITGLAVQENRCYKTV